MNKETKTMGVNNVPIDKLETIKSIFEEYAEDISTIKIEPATYKIIGEIPKERCVDFYKVMDEKVGKNE